MLPPPPPPPPRHRVPAANVCCRSARHGPAPLSPSLPPTILPLLPAPASFRFDANAELAPEGFCQISCSRCNCCEPPTDVLKTLGANRFLQVRL